MPCFGRAGQDLAGTAHYDVMRELLATTEAKVLLAIDEYNELFQMSHWHYGDSKVSLVLFRRYTTRGEGQRQGDVGSEAGGGGNLLAYCCRIQHPFAESEMGKLLFCMECPLAPCSRGALHYLHQARKYV